MFRRMKNTPQEEVEVPDWTEAPYNLLAFELCTSGLAESWDSKLKGSEPHDLVQVLEGVPAKAGDVAPHDLVQGPEGVPAKAGDVAPLGRRMWILASAYRGMHKRNQSLQKKCSQLEQELSELGGQKMVLECNTRMLRDKVEHYQGVAEKAAVKVAQNKYKKRKGKVNKQKVYKSIAVASIDWDPDKWDGDIRDDTDSSDREEWEDPPDPTVDPPGYKAYPVRKRSEWTDQGMEQAKDGKLLKAGVKKEQIDGKETGELWRLYKQKVQRVPALIDTGAEATLICGNPNKFKGPKIQIVGLGGKVITGVQTQVALKIGNLPIRKYSVLVVPIPEYILGIDVLKGMTLHLQEGRYAFGVSSTQIQARPVLVGKVKMLPVHIPPAAKMVAMKQYRIPGGHKEITETIRELVEVGVMRPTTTTWNNPVWPVKKSDGSWRMTIDYRELNKQTPPLTAAVPDTITIVEAIQSHPGTWYAVIDLANAFFTIPIEENGSIGSIRFHVVGKTIHLHPTTPGMAAQPHHMPSSGGRTPG
ncbi:RNA-mediated [Pristimantis euphronides]